MPAPPRESIGRSTRFIEWDPPLWWLASIFTWKKLRVAGLPICFKVVMIFAR